MDEEIEEKNKYVEMQNKLLEKGEGVTTVFSVRI